MLCLVVLGCFSVSSDAALIFKITSNKSQLTVGETTTIHVWAWADDLAATGSNGLNSWQLSAMVDNSGGRSSERVYCVCAPSPWSTNVSDTGKSSINTPKTGMIDYLRLLTNELPQDSSAGGGYSEIARFDIKAIGAAGSSVVYTLGGSNFGGFERLHSYV
jgi:hypothetical protein